jgi:hypothetical protein
MIAGSDGQQRHKEAGYGTGVIAVVDMGRTITFNLRKQTAEQSGVTGGGGFGDAEASSTGVIVGLSHSMQEMVNHQPSIAHAFGGGQGDTYVVSLH